MPGLWTWRFLRRFAQVWLPLVLLLVLVVWLLFRTERDAHLTIAQANEEHSIRLARHTIDTELGMLHGDALYLADLSSLHRWLDSRARAARGRLASDLLAFARRRGLYDQVRFIDEHGREVVRVNWNSGRPALVPADDLQDKSGRYYVQEALRLGRGKLYISPFDLNVEHHAIETPVKPEIRLATPVFDQAGRKRGLIVLNYIGRRLLDHLRSIPGPNGNQLWMLNGEGYWLVGPRPAMEWGFMFPGRGAMRFGHRYRNIWTAVRHGPRHGQFTYRGALFTYARLAPMALLGGVGDARWILVGHMTQRALAAGMSGQRRNLLAAFISLTALLALLGGVVAHHGVRRERAEDAVRESGIRFRGLLESAPDAIVIADYRGMISLANAQTERWFGYSREELVGQPIEMLVPARFVDQHVAQRERYMSSPVTRPMGAGIELYGLRKDGTEFPVEISLSPLGGGQGLLVTSSIRDVSRRKLAEQAQRRVEHRYQELVTNLPVGVYRNTPGIDGRFVEVNPAVVAMFEADSVEHLLACSVSDLYRDPGARDAFSEKLLRHGYVSGEVLPLKTLRGREFYAAITAVVLKDAAAGVYFDGIIEDISARVEGERRILELNDSLSTRSRELEVSNRELEAFSYSVAHDLRAPLRAIDGFSRILMDDCAGRLDEQGREFLGRVRAAAQHMGILIDDLLTLSRVTRAELKFERVDLTGLVNDVMERLRKGDPQRNVEIRAQRDLQVMGDARLLRIAMDNLLGNAWKFTGTRDRALIQVGTEVVADGVAFYVRDNGVGFDMAYADKLFLPFQRMHDTDEFPGTGIGLATVHRVIQKHGGRIWADGAVDGGAVFHFTLGQRGN